MNDEDIVKLSSFLTYAYELNPNFRINDKHRSCDDFVYCDNCNDYFPRNERFDPHEHSHVDSYAAFGFLWEPMWCDPRCFLSYILPLVVEKEELLQRIRETMNDPFLMPFEPRHVLEIHGGTVPLEVYKMQTTTDSGNKRQNIDFDAAMDTMDDNPIPLLDRIDQW